MSTSGLEAGIPEPKRECPIWVIHVGLPVRNDDFLSTTLNRIVTVRRDVSNVPTAYSCDLSMIAAARGVVGMLSSYQEFELLSSFCKWRASNWFISRRSNLLS